MSDGAEFIGRSFRVTDGESIVTVYARCVHEGYQGLVIWWNDNATPHTILLSSFKSWLGDGIVRESDPRSAYE